MQHNVRPRYEVEAVDDTVEVTKFRRNMDTGMNEEYIDTEPYGFNVYFPAGHSIRVRDRAELKRLGFDLPPDLIDMESGDVVGEAATSLKQHVHRRASKPRRADTGGVDAEQGG